MNDPLRQALRESPCVKFGEKLREKLRNKLSEKIHKKFGEKRIRDPITDYLFETVLPKPTERPCYRCRHFEESKIKVENITFEMNKCRRPWVDSANRTLPLYVSFLRNNESFCGNGGKYYTPDLSTTNTTIGDISTTNTTIGDISTTNTTIGDISTTNATSGDLNTPTIYPH
jgi:hypothetical protein